MPLTWLLVVCRQLQAFLGLQNHYSDFCPHLHMVFPYVHLSKFPLCTIRATVILACCCSVAKSVWLFATPWTAAHQAPLSFTISWSSLKLMSIESVKISNHLFLCHPLLLLPCISQQKRWVGFFTSGGQSIGDSASASALPMNIQRWFPLGLTGLILD